MKLLIYGGGAVGLGIASCLVKSGQDIDIIAREGTVNSLRERGLMRSGIFGKYRAYPDSFNGYSSLKDLPEARYDCILVCTKAHDLRVAAQDLSKHRDLQSDDSKIILFQNGWGNADIFTSFFPKKRIFNGRVITGFRRPQKNHVEITVHADAIHLGSLFNENSSHLKTLSESISDGGIPCRLTNEIGKDLFAKLLYNCALNPLGAIFEVPYGVLGEWDHTRNIMNKIVDETFRIMLKSENSTHWKTPGDYLATFYEELLPPTATHESSMLQDIRLKKKTEIDFLNGAVVELGKRIDLEAPTNFTVCNMLKFMEAKAMSDR